MGRDSVVKSFDWAVVSRSVDSGSMEASLNAAGATVGIASVDAAGLSDDGDASSGRIRPVDAHPQIETTAKNARDFIWNFFAKMVGISRKTDLNRKHPSFYRHHEIVTIMRVRETRRSYQSIKVTKRQACIWLTHRQLEIE